MIYTRIKSEFERLEQRIADVQECLKQMPEGSLLCEFDVVGRLKHPERLNYKWVGDNKKHRKGKTFKKPLDILT